ncbi:EF-hand domain and EF-hand domain pair-containing protein [Strongyloides ratti]|uniref:EF-hand domain and EF-hand domain pair-containing protein n=1 Tax=Strongyloides ratti TaxID=34506 RepID=A0A090MV83_STRRB|nr:EF-hand domain and EF-hand domain pair-containing protein [Strongyloides ratti]CEF62718.1 EF-hand domain and EF-hand domain pair-containing protein [Strongyloides ratti]
MTATIVNGSHDIIINNNNCVTDNEDKKLVKLIIKGRDTGKLYQDDEITPLEDHSDSGGSEEDGNFSENPISKQSSEADDEWLIDESYNRILEQLNMVSIFNSLNHTSASPNDDYIAAGSYTLRKWRKEMKFPLSPSISSTITTTIPKPSLPIPHVILCDDDDSGLQMSSNEELELDNDYGEPSTSSSSHNSLDEDNSDNIKSTSLSPNTQYVKFTLRDKSRKHQNNIIDNSSSVPLINNRISQISINGDSQTQCFCSPVIPLWVFRKKNKKKIKVKNKNTTNVEVEESYGYLQDNKNKRKSLVPDDLPKGPIDNNNVVNRKRKVNLLRRVIFGNLFRRIFDGGKNKSNEEKKRNDKKEKCFSPRWKDDVADEATVVKIHQNVITSKNNGRTPTPTIEKINHQGRITQPSYDNSYSISSNNNNISNISITIPSPKNNIISTSSSSLPPPPSSTVGKSLTNIPSTVSPIPSYAGKLANVPRFYYPNGKPISPSENDAALRRVAIIFSNLNNGLVEYNEMYKLCDAIKVPTYWKRPIYDACMKLAGKPSPITTDTKRGTLTYQEFANYWNNMTSSCHDEASRFIYTLAIGNFNKEIVSPKSIRNHILKEDFIPMLTDLIETYPGLDFLRDAPNFHMRYIDVVTVRIFWSVNRSWSGKITASELRKSNFLQTIKIYEHFYVTYCKFWEIDEDHDLIISQDDMKRHCNGAIPSKVIERIFSSAVNRRMTKGQCNGKFSNDVMGFQEFVAFLLAEEDKKHPTSIEYWFRVIDLDGDGVISLNEMEYFHTEIMQQMEIRNYEGNSLKDVICNLLDMISPAMENKVTLCDIKRSGLAHRFFNAFVNVYKFIDQETTDGERPSIRTEGDKEMSDWDAFCAVEYENLMTENNDSEVMDDEVPYDENIDINLFEDE